MTEEDREMRKPFWARTYFVGTREFKLDRDFIDGFMKSANVMVKDNRQAYHDYKKRALFPKVTDPGKAFLQHENMSFVEFQEK